MITIERQDAPAGRYAYLMTGEVNGEAHDREPVLKASKVLYSHASLTTIPAAEGPRDVLGFHKTAAAASKGHSALRRYATAVTVIEITQERPR